MMIDYKNIVHSIEYYASVGYDRVELPWTVSRRAALETTPPNKRLQGIANNGRVLPGSAEQCFLHQYMQGMLPLGKFQSVTPCFRDEVVDDLHQEQFLKNELIVTKDPSEQSLKYMIRDAGIFMSRSLGVREEDLSVVDTSNGAGVSYDILYKCADSRIIELGSYGIRECNFLKWVYGTGCAEPRMSYVKRQIELNNGIKEKI